MTIDTSKFEKIALEIDEDGIVVLSLDRPDKRNALDTQCIEELVSVFTALPLDSAIRAVVLRAEGEHFCAGLDLVEHHRSAHRPEDFMRVCMRWHEAFNKMEYGGVPIIAALKGAVVGGGLELAAAAHVRVADRTTYFALPEGQRGLFTGGGATIRVPALIGKARMMDMMLTGRVYDYDEAERIGLCQYVAEDSDALALKIARQSLSLTPLSGFAICSGISHFQNMSALDAAYAEAVLAGMVNTQPAAGERLEAFADKTAARVRPGQRLDGPQD